MNANPGLKPAREKIFQNGTTKKIAAAISQGKIPNSSMSPPSRLMLNGY
jgi:hypothetical protein